MRDRALILDGLRRYRDAADTLDRHLSGNPTDAGALILRAPCDPESGRFDASVVRCKEAIGLAPESSHGYFVLANAIRRNVQGTTAPIDGPGSDALHEGRTRIEEAIRINPQGPYLSWNRPTLDVAAASPFKGRSRHIQVH